MGGLTVLDSLIDRMQQTNFVCYADSAHAPYGLLGVNVIYEKAVISLLLPVILFLGRLLDVCKKVGFQKTDVC